MLNDLKVKVGPQFYRYHVGAINFVADVLAEYVAKNVLIVHGTVSWEKLSRGSAFYKMNVIRFLIINILVNAVIMEQIGLLKL